ncbi:hypothetical protein BC829DRAFT_447450 [Chytridium lagenaria]|nr:hypothetical protein BC829DRAFT_447450 [Chytridium lagenaria]
MSLPNLPGLPDLPSLPTINTTFPDISALPYIPDPTPYNLTGGQGLLGVIAILIGGVFIIMGKNPAGSNCLSVLPAVGGCLGYILLSNVEPKPQGYPSREYVILFGSLGIGALAGGLLLCLRRLSVFAIGAVGGFFLALFILGWRTNGLIESGWGLCFGVDCYARVGFIEASGNFLSTRSLNDYDYVLTPRVIALAATCGVLALIGILIQYRFNGNKKGFHQ